MNDFSMSEHEGNLRIATTDGSPWGGFGNGGDRSESFVHVLSHEGQKLKTIGSVGGLGKGEQIFSVRFLGEMAYVVTFRQTDPLYTIDLSEPRSPKLTVGLDGIVERGRVEHERIDSGRCEWEEEWYENDDAEASFAEPDRPSIEPAMPIPPPQDCFNPGWGAEIQRSLIIDDAIYTISESGLAVSTIDDLTRESWLRFG